jgi:hypothetical protein
MPEDISPLELVDELHRRQGEMYAGGSIDAVIEILAEDIVWHVGMGGHCSTGCWSMGGGSAASSSTSTRESASIAPTLTGST